MPCAAAAVSAWRRVGLLMLALAALASGQMVTTPHTGTVDGATGDWSQAFERSRGMAMPRTAPSFCTLTRNTRNTQGVTAPIGSSRGTPTRSTLPSHLLTL